MRTRNYLECYHATNEQNFISKCSFQCLVTTSPYDALSSVEVVGAPPSEQRPLLLTYLPYTPYTSQQSQSPEQQYMVLYPSSGEIFPPLVLVNLQGQH
jgi:hypothetical protein